jgi:hypothetical protein
MDKVEECNNVGGRADLWEEVGKYKEEETFDCRIEEISSRRRWHEIQK